MITVEIRINGSPIAIAQAANRSSLSEQSEYEVQSVYFPIDNAGAPRTGNYMVGHKRSDGALTLVQKILRVMTERIQT